MTGYPSSEKLIAEIDEILNRYGSIIESCMPVFRPQAYEAALEELVSIKVQPKINRGDAARWLRAKGYPKE